MDTQPKKKIIAVVGATGAQGGGLARAILADAHGPFTLRAITRDPGSAKAKALAAAGAKVVAADCDDAASMRRAFDGAHGAFCVTNFWEHFSPDREQAQARNMAQAAHDAGVRHVIWSTLEDTRRWVPIDDDRMPTLMGRFKVPHLDAKGEADAVFDELGVPTTFLLTSFYWDNFIHFGLGPKPGPDGTLAITLPIGDARLPGMAAEDIGKCALGVFRGGASFIGRRVAVAAEHLSGDEMAAGLGRALGAPVRYQEVSPATYRTFGFPGADDLGNMFQFMRDVEEFRAVRDVEATRALNPELQTFDRWLAEHGEQIPLPGAPGA